MEYKNSFAKIYYFRELSNDWNISLYDEYFQQKYSKSFYDYLKDCHFMYTDIFHLLEYNYPTIIGENIINSKNKLLCFAILAGRPTTFLKLADYYSFDLNDYIECFKKIPPFILANSRVDMKEVIISKIFDDPKAFKILLNNLEYYHLSTYSHNSYDYVKKHNWDKKIFDNVDEVINNMTSNPNFDYARCYYYPKILFDSPKFQDVISKHLEDIASLFTAEVDFDDNFSILDYDSRRILKDCPNYLLNSIDFQNLIINKFDHAISPYILGDLSKAFNDNPNFLKKVTSDYKKYALYLNKIADNKNILNSVNNFIKQYYPSFLISDSNFVKMYIELFKPDSLKVLPKEAQNTSVALNVFNNNFLTPTGSIKQFFQLANGLEIKTIDDYRMIYEKYIKSNTSVRLFCNKYGITPIEGFEKFLKAYGNEFNDANSQIKEVKLDVQNKFFNACCTSMKDLLNNKIDFESFLTNLSNESVKNSGIDFFFNNILSNNNDRTKFSKIILDYVNSHQYFINSNFFPFIYDQSCTNVFQKYSYYLNKYLDDKNKSMIVRQSCSIIGALSKQYIRNGLYCKYIKNDKEYIINDDIIDQALAYSRANHYHICAKEMQFLCKQIALGEIVYDKETDLQKDAMADKYINLLEEAKTIEKYLNTIEQIKKMEV